jgi:type I restriction enzyme S subunit
MKQAAMQQLLTGRTRVPGFEKHPCYKNTEIGVIPEDWELATLGSVCQVFGRIGFRGYTINDIVLEGEGVIAISPSNIQGHCTDFSNCTYISWQKYEESPEIKIYNGDVLLVKTGSTYGKTAIVQNLSEKATLNPQVIVLKRIHIHNCYLSYVMAFSIIQKQISTAVVGGALPTLSQKLVGKFKLPLPPLPEQTVIATVLSDMDAGITALERRRDKVKEIKQGMMQQLLTGRVRLAC